MCLETMTLLELPNDRALGIFGITSWIIYPLIVVGAAIGAYIKPPHLGTALIYTRWFELLPPPFAFSRLEESLAMGDNIHAPTVASGPTSGGIQIDWSKLTMPELMQQKEKIEEELKALSTVLTSVSLHFHIDDVPCIP